MSSTDATAARADNSALINARPRVTVNGEEWPAIGDGILAAQVSLPLHGCGHGEIRLMNWGTGAAEGEFAFRDLALGDEIALSPGESAEGALFTGEVTAIEEVYGDGAPQLTLLLQDRLHRLARCRASRRFADMDVDGVIGAVAQEAGVETDTNVGGARATYLQHNESDLAFLMRLTAAYGIGLRWRDGTLIAKPEEPDGDPFRLNMQDGTVRRARIIADLNHQPLAVSVKGHDLSADEAPEHEADALSPPPSSGRTAAAILDELGWEGGSVVPHPFARRTAEAEGLANAQFARMARRFVRGDLCCAGAPPLRPGRQVTLSGVAERFQGTYRVVDCLHRFDQAEGYVTDIRIQREVLS